MPLPSPDISHSANVTYLNVGASAWFVRNPVSLVQDFQLDYAEDDIWPSAVVSSKNLQNGYVYRPPGPYRDNFLLLTDAVKHSFTLPGHKFLEGDFNSQSVCWHTFTALNCLLTFTAKIQQEGWMRYTAHPSRNRNIQEPIFAIVLMHFCTSIQISFPGCDHLPLACKFVLPFQGSILSPITVPLWGGLSNLLLSCNWDPFFLAVEAQVKTGKFYSLLH